MPMNAWLIQMHWQAAEMFSQHAIGIRGNHKMHEYVINQSIIIASFSFSSDFKILVLLCYWLISFDSQILIRFKGERRLAYFHQKTLI